MGMRQCMRAYIRTYIRGYVVEREIMSKHDCAVLYVFTIGDVCK